MPNAKLWPQRKAQPGFPALEPSPRNSNPHLGLCTRWPRFSANSLLTFQVRIASQARERSNIFALLRVSRQIYAETALLPYNVNTFAVEDLSSNDVLKAGKSANRLKKYQLGQITELEIRLTNAGVMCRYPWIASLNPSKFTVLTGLRRITIQVFSCDEWRTSSFSQIETRLRSFPCVSLLLVGYEIVVEKMDLSWIAYNAE
jgi:hypothetical protein